MWDGFGVGAFLSDPTLSSFGKEFVGQFAKPGFEHRANDVDVVKVVLLEEVNIVLCYVLADPTLGNADPYLRQISAAIS